MTDIYQRAAVWALSGDTGASSSAIARHMLGVRGISCHSPRDSADLGRCLRLLDAVPEWRERMPEMAKYSPEWASIVGAWDELASLHKRDPEKCYRRMIELRMEANSEANQACSKCGAPGASPVTGMCWSCDTTAL